MIMKGIIFIFSVFLCFISCKKEETYTKTKTTEIATLPVFYY